MLKTRKASLVTSDKMSTENHNYSPFLLWKDLVREVREGILTVGGIFTVIMGSKYCILFHYFIIHESLILQMLENPKFHPNLVCSGFPRRDVDTRSSLVSELAKPR